MDSMSAELRESAMELSEGNPSMTYRGALLCVRELLPLIVILASAPREPSEVVTTTPAESRPMRENEVNALLYEKKESLPVDRIKVGLLLPFKADKPTRDAATARFVEYYEGMLLAVDSLRKQGVSIELSVYDTGEGARAMNQILETEENLRSANLLIGAVQNDQIGPLADFAQKHKIKYVIPFTSKNDDVLSNASVFQVNTPHSYLYSKAAQAGCDLFADHNIVIVNIKDKDEKTDFIKAFKEEMKSRGIAHKELTYNAATFTTDIEALLIRDKRNVVLPTSASLDAVNKIKTPLRMLAETQPEVEEGEEKVNLEELLSECRTILVSAVKCGKKKDVENLFSKIGITALSNASAGQLVEFKKEMTGFEV